MLWDAVRGFEMLLRCFWDVLRCCEMLEETFKGFKVFRNALSDFGRFSDDLRCFEMLWEASRDFEMIWKNLGGFEMLWEAVRGFEGLLRCFEGLLRCFEGLLRCFEMFWKALIDHKRSLKMLRASLRIFEVIWDSWLVVLIIKKCFKILVLISKILQDSSRFFVYLWVLRNSYFEAKDFSSFFKIVL